MKILLIEDDELDAEVVTRSITRALPGSKITQAVRLDEALECVRTNQCGFDIVLSDLSLPDCSGLDAVEAMVKACPNCPIVVLTGCESRHHSLKAISYGAQDYLVKTTITPELLERSIQHSIERHGLMQRNARLLKAIRHSEVLLHEKNRKLERACKTAQEFVDNVSHEFRTPLTVIMEYASILADSIAGPVTAEQAKLLGIIDDRASDLNHMVDDMLDVSKLESGLLSASRSRCTANEIIDHVLPAIRRKALVREVQLDVDIAEDLPGIFCDSAKAGRVIVNLATNAIKFSRSPGKVSIFARSNGDDEILIGVSDNGVGIPMERQREIFNRFSQVKSGVCEETKGFGLGLNIAQELVGLNLGTMHVESTENVGSTFSFTVPINCPLEITQRFVERRKWDDRDSDYLSAIQIRTTEFESDSINEDLERFLIHVLRQNDIIFPVSGGEWLLIVSAASLALDDFFERLNTQHELINRNRPSGPLPEFQSSVLGTWKVNGDCSELTAIVRGHCYQQEDCTVV